ncbi:meiosis-specific kinetochore protein [Sorex fumeus]|uniref:meiosis-specific kinetochore protein n=1 Tax=Sorex fumeus TaxID=62283 RepID=UPI0024AC9265|nr:meiosis-specific kinetochore protein [Sorex fumeus]
MAVWLRAYTRKKRAGQRLNLTPTPDLGAWAKAEEAPPGSGLRGAARGLRKISEKAERSPQEGDGSALLSPQLRFTRENSLEETSAREETEENAALSSESETDGLQADSSLSNSDLVSGLSLQDHNSLLNCSAMDSSKESLSSFPSPEVFRGSDYFDWACPKLEEHMLCKNSTLLDTSKAVAIEKAPLFPNLSAILGTSSEDYQKCHKKIVTITLADQNVSSKPKSTSNPESDNAACEILLAEKPCTLIPEKLKRKKLNSSTSNKKSKGLLTSTPSSQTAALVIDLSSVQRASFEELFPNVSNYVNSNEIVPVSGLQEISSNEISSDASEKCCIVRASPGIRKMGNRTLRKKKYSPPKDIPQDIIIKTNGRM